MTGGISRIAAIEKQGWTMRFVAGEPRLSETVEIYRRAGFEVLLERLEKNAGCKDCPGVKAEGECRLCFEGFEDQYKIVFTRPLKDVYKDNDNEGLF